MAQKTPEGDRIAKVLARAGVASRREAERMIEAGRVRVNGQIIERAALNVTEKDRIEVDGKPLDAPEPERLWLYHKPTGLVTSHRDEQGRATIFDELPEDMPRVMSVGRLDLNSEGLLLLTNDGGWNCRRPAGCASTACGSRDGPATKCWSRCARGCRSRAPRTSR